MPKGTKKKKVRGKTFAFEVVSEVACTVIFGVME
jgi:hypothetical protein